MKKIRTMRDVRRANKLPAYQVDEADRARRVDSANRFFAALHPQIGMLMRDGRAVYYVNAPGYRESTDPRELVDPDHATA